MAVVHENVGQLLNASAIKETKNTYHASNGPSCEGATRKANDKKLVASTVIVADETVSLGNVLA